MFRFFLLLFCLALCSCQKKHTVINQATEEGILVIGNSNEPKSLDPHLVSGVLESNLIRSLFEGLCTEHPSQNGEALPGAATHWTSNKEFTEWTFHLRPEALWSDGVPVTAKDFVFSYHRILTPSLGAKYASMLYFLKNAERFNKNQRGYFLCGPESEFSYSWDFLKQLPFQPDSSVNIEEFQYTAFDQLTAHQKQQFIRKKGLDYLGANTLTAISKDPSCIPLPSGVSPEALQAVLQTLIQWDKEEHLDLWDIANVGVKAVNDYTLKLTLRGPLPFLPELTKHFTWYPVPRHIVLSNGWKINTPYTDWVKPEHIVSNGPFTLKKWKITQLIEVTKNDRYWDAKNVALKGIRFLPVTNAYTEARMFLNHQLHATYTLPPEMIQYAKKKRPEALKQEPYIGSSFLRCNIKRTGLDSLKFRQALSASIDRKLLIDSILQGGQTPATGLTPPFGNYKPPQVASFDPKKAKQLFDESGVSPSIKLTLLTTDRDTNKALAEVLQGMWKEHLGIQVRIIQREWSTFQTLQQKGDYDLATGGWIGDFLDPTTFLDLWKKGDGNNNTGWSDANYEQLLTKAENTADPNARLQTLVKAETLALNAAPFIPLYWFTSNYLLHPNVKGWHPLLLNNHPYKYIRFAP